MKNLLITLSLLALILSCSSEGNKDGAQNAGEATEKTSGSDMQKSFGEEFQAAQINSVGSAIGVLDSLDEMETVVHAKVGEVCQVKGCWMNVSDVDGQGEMFVQFKDYGFFMPKDLTGHEVIMKGKVYKEMTSVDDLRHFAEDEGKSAEEIAAITEPEEEFKFMASGVKIVK